jgi:hypothetical protein
VQNNPAYFHEVVGVLQQILKAFLVLNSNNLTNLSHQANSSAWQQTIAIHPNNNRGTETQQSATDFDTNGNRCFVVLLY